MKDIIDIILSSFILLLLLGALSFIFCAISINRK